MIVAKKLKIITPAILVLALGIIASGAFLQWRLSHVVSHPNAVLLLAAEKNLVSSLQEMAANLVFDNGEQSADKLDEMRTTFDSWVINHRKLVAIADEPGMDEETRRVLKNHVFPRYGELANSFTEIFNLTEGQAALSPAEVRPYVEEVEARAILYNFYLDHFDLHLAHLATEKIQSLQMIEGMLIISSGVLLLAVLFWLFIPAAKVINQYNKRLNQLETAHQQKNDFLAVLGHELRNPLATISGGIQVLKSKPADIEKMLNIIDNNVHLISSLLDDMLDLARIERGDIMLHKEIFDIRSAAKSAVQHVAGAMEEKKQHFEIDLPEGPLWIDADPVRIEQVITNLLTNANKYTQPGGHIQLLVEEREGNISVLVRDDGLGIAPDELQKIFKPFVRTRKAISTPGSLGIGLALVKRLTEQHNGTVKADSGGEGKGSEFVLNLPKAESAGIEKPEKPEEPSLEIRKGLRVMMVDDNPETLTGTEIFLEKRDCIVDKATNAEEAIEAAKTFHPDVFLLDIGMPGMDGYDLSRYLRTHGYSDSLIIAVSGFGHEDAHRMSDEAGIDYHLNKPVNYHALAELLASERVSERGSVL